MKKLLGIGLCASLLLNAVLLLQPRREPPPEPALRTQFVERGIAAPPPPVESIPRTLPAPVPDPVATSAPSLVVSLLASPAYAAPGGQIGVQVIVSSGVPSPKHWIALYPLHAHRSNYCSYNMVVQTAERFAFEAPRKAGDYEVRYFLEDDTQVAVSNPIKVMGELAPSVRVELLSSAAAVKCGGDIPAFWALRSGLRSSRDWVGIFAPEASNTGFVSWKYVPDGDGGQMMLQAPDRPGTYELRYLLDNGYECAAVSSRIVVVE